MVATDAAVVAAADDSIVRIHDHTAHHRIGRHPMTTSGGQAQDFPQIPIAHSFARLPSIFTDSSWLRSSLATRGRTASSRGPWCDEASSSILGGER